MQTAEVVLLRPLTWLNEQHTGRSFLPERTFAERRTNARDAIEDFGTDLGIPSALIGRDESRSPARQAGPTVESQAVEDMVGGTVFISVPECGIDGNARVLAVQSCPEIPNVAISLREMSPDLSRVDANAANKLFSASQNSSQLPAGLMTDVHSKRLVSAERDGYMGRNL